MERRRRADRIPPARSASRRTSARARSLTRDRAAGGDAAPASSAASPADPDLAWHRLATGGQVGRGRRMGVRLPERRVCGRDEYVLDIGCGSLSAASHFCASWSRATTGDSSGTWSCSSPASRSSCRAPASARELGHFLVERRFRLSKAAAPVRSGDRQLALPAAAAEQRRARDRHVVRALTPGGRSSPRGRESGPGQLRADRPARRHDHVQRSRAVPLRLRDARALAASSAPAPNALEDRTHPRGESVMVITRIEAPRECPRDDR